MIAHFHGRIPILGVCLGHQVICEMNGGRVDRAGAIVHGKPDLVSHDGSELFAGLPNPFEAGRYHSLAALGPDPRGADRHLPHAATARSWVCGIASTPPTGCSFIPSRC